MAANATNLPGATLEVSRARRRFQPGGLRLLDVQVCAPEAEGMEHDFAGQAPAEAPASAEPKKVIWFVRHGQSTANIAGNTARKQPEFRDAPLTDVGVAQARALQPIVPEWRAQLVIVSPLTRALQTCCLAFEHTDAMFVVNPMCTESWPEYQENMGRAPEEVRGDRRLSELKRFGSLRWDDCDGALQGDWWRIGGDRERYQAFLTAVAATPHERIVVVCHWGFINQLMAACGANVSLQNCQWARTEWT